VPITERGKVRTKPISEWSFGAYRFVFEMRIYM
jgi:hypothetical protein